MTRVYMMEAAFLSRLRADRKEILALAKSLGTAEEMRKARDDLMAGTRINITPKAGDDATKCYTIDGEGVAHIAMLGELTPAAQKDVCGAYTAEALTEYGFLIAAIQAADADPHVSAIALDANTPGGYADGVDMVAQVFAAALKPTMAIVADSMQSAGYYIGSQADKIIALSPTSKVGSVGTVVVEMDDTRALEAEGIDRREYTATDSPLKRPDGSTEEGRAQFVAYADGLQRVFIDRVASGRHVSAQEVRDSYGKGSTVFAMDALKSGMIDEIQGMKIERKIAGVAGVQTAAKADGTLKTGGAKHMTLEELKRDHPALYAEAIADARKTAKVEGIAEEHARNASYDATLAADPGNAKLAAIVAEAKASGKDLADPALQAQINVAIRDNAGKAVDDDNPPAIPTASSGGGNANGSRPDILADAKRTNTSPQELLGEERRMLAAAGFPADYLSKGGK